MNTRTLKISTMWRGVLPMALLGLALTASDASARLLQMRSSIDPQQDASSPYPATFLQLSAGLTSATFSTSGAQYVRVIFNAECSIGGSTTNYLDSTIYIDPSGAAAEFAVAPSNSDNALCSGNGTASYSDGQVSAVTQVFAWIPTAGVHRIRVQVTPVPAAPWRIDDMSLVIDDQ